MSSSADNGALVRAANEMYWESDSSVNHIAERLDVSKGTLYSLIRPLPSEMACPHCGTEMVYTNRTALERGFLECPECEYEEEEAVVREVMGDEPLEAEGPAAGAGGTERFPVQVVAGVGLLGVAAGILLARTFGRD